MAATLLWFLGFWVAFADDGVRALADRVARRPDHRAVAPGVPGTAAPAVAEADPDEDGDDPAGDGAGTGAGDGSGSAARAAVKIAHLEDTCIDGADADCRRWAMDGFYAAVAAARAGTADHPVRVSYYGDSVTSTDAVPARVRSRLQKELGDGGPGWVWAARPHRFVYHEVVSTTDSGKWTTWSAAIGPASDGLHGVANATAETQSGTAVLVSKTPFAAVDVYYLAQPGGGTLAVALDGAPAATLDTRRDVKAAEFARAQAAAPAKRVELAATGKVRLFGVVLENATGAVVDNMGLVSATVKNLAHNRADHWTHQLAHRAADLVVIMVGANEAEWLPAGKAAMAEYTTQYEALLAPIRAALPAAGCLVVSPLDQAHADEVTGELASRPVMPMMVAAQRTAARASGCAFFSAYDWAGGKGSALVWHRKGWVGDDFQHLSRRGANRLADALVNALLAGAKDYAAR